jgi:hypothetical protein
VSDYAAEQTAFQAQIEAERAVRFELHPRGEVEDQEFEEFLEDSDAAERKRNEAFYRMKLAR